MNPDVVDLFGRQHLATTADLLTVITRRQLDVQVRNGRLVRVWRGVYSLAEPDLLTKRAAMLRDRARFAGVQDMGWIVVPIVVDDVRLTPGLMCERIAGHLARGRLVG